MVGLPQTSSESTVLVAGDWQRQGHKQIGVTLQALTIRKSLEQTNSEITSENSQD